MLGNIYPIWPCPEALQDRRAAGCRDAIFKQFKGFLRIADLPPMVLAAGPAW